MLTGSQAARTVNNIIRQQERNRCINQKSTYRKKDLLRQIKSKLNDNEAIVSKADKGNSIVILLKKGMKIK
jgi:hypothetical protein